MILPDDTLIKKFVDYSIEDRAKRNKSRITKLAVVLAIIPVFVYFFDVTVTEFYLFCYISFSLLLLASLYGLSLQQNYNKKKKLRKIIKEGKYKSFVFLYSSNGLSNFLTGKYCTVLNFFDINSPNKTVRIRTNNYYFIKFVSTLKEKPFTMLIHDQYPEYYLPLDYIQFLVKQKTKETPELLKLL